MFRKIAFGAAIALVCTSLVTPVLAIDRGQYDDPEIKQWFKDPDAAGQSNGQLLRCG